MTANDLLRQIPTVLRARGFHLYTQGGRRLIDLWLNGGAAVLGHTPPNVLRELKNTASRGLYAPFPHFTEGRFNKALRRLFPGHSFRLYAAPPQELSALFASGLVRLWRPFVDLNDPFAINNDAIYNEDSTSTAPDSNAVMRLLVLPGIQTWSGELPVGLCVVAASSEDHLSQLPTGDTLPPILLAVASRGTYDILASPQRAKPVLPRTDKALQTNTFWQRWGIYLTPKEKPSNDEWEILFRRFLDAGFLLPPTPFQPLILPGELSPGEDAKLAAALT